MLDQETQPRKRQRTEQGVPAELGQPGADGAATASPEDSVGCPDPSMPGCMKVPVGVSSHVPPGLASMGMPCNGCSCGASLGSHPGMLGIMHQQQQYMMHQMGMFNHMMMMGAMMSPMMGQMISPTPTDGTLLATTSPSSLPDPALVASKLDEDDDDPRRTCVSFSVMHVSQAMPCSAATVAYAGLHVKAHVGRHISATALLRCHPALRQISTIQTIGLQMLSQYQVGEVEAMSELVM